MKKRYVLRLTAALLGLALTLAPVQQVHAAGGFRNDFRKRTGALAPVKTPASAADSARAYTGSDRASAAAEPALPRPGLPDIGLPKPKLPKLNIPDLPSDFHIDKATEKKRLAEAIRQLDEYGLSPEKLVEHFWDYISRRENRDRIGEKAGELKKKAEDLRDGAGKLMEKDSAGSSDSGSSGTTAGLALPEEARQEIDRVRKTAAEEAGRKIEEAVDAAADQAAQKAAEEIDSAAEAVKQEVMDQ